MREGEGRGPPKRTQLGAREQSEIAIVASRWSAVPRAEQGDVLTRLPDDRGTEDRYRRA